MECSVYQIKCLKNGKIYIGSSSNTKYRWSVHKQLLRSGRHFSPHLQAAWNKYGEDQFVFEVVERCDTKSRYCREQYHLDQQRSYDPSHGFNISCIAGKSPGTSIPTTFESPSGDMVYGNSIKDVSRQTGVPHSVLCAIASGKRKHYRGWKLPSTTISYHPHRVISPNGTVFCFDVVADFAKEHKLSQQMLYHLLKGRITQHRGWTLWSTSQN
jgi:group I intron endonuclease